MSSTKIEEQQALDYEYRRQVEMYRAREIRRMPRVSLFAPGPFDPRYDRPVEVNYSPDSTRYFIDEVAVWNDSPPQPQKTKEELKASFQDLMLKSGFKRTQTIQEVCLHEIRLGDLDEFNSKREKERKKNSKKKGESQVATPFVLCGVCGYPDCPWSG